MNIIEQIENTRKEYESDAVEAFVGRTITGVRYQTDEELEKSGWKCRALLFTLDDGAEILLISDPEGNGPGAIFYSKDTKREIFGPVWKPELR